MNHTLTSAHARLLDVSEEFNLTFSQACDFFKKAHKLPEDLRKFALTTGSIPQCSGEDDISGKTVSDIISVLSPALVDILHVISDGKWHMIEVVAKKVTHSVTGTSAMMRDLRKEKCGKWGIECESHNGIFEYRLVDSRIKDLKSQP